MAIVLYKVTIRQVFFIKEFHISFYLIVPPFFDTKRELFTQNPF